MSDDVMLIFKKLQKEFNDKELFIIVCNPNSEKGIDKNDEIFLWKILQGVQVKNGILILHGQGGLFETGLVMAHIARRHFSHLVAFVPSICCSALCLLFLKADKLLMTERTKITQIDPIFEIDGTPLRAIKFLHSDDPEKKDIARSAFQYARFHVMKLIQEKPSLFDFRNVDFEDFGHSENIVDTFMNKDEHHAELKYSEIKELDLKVEPIKNEALEKLSNELIQECQKLLIKDGKRLMIASTAEIKVDSDKGHIMMV